MPARTSELTKRLHGTARKRPAPPSVGTLRLTKAIPPPSDLSPELAEQWQRHMHMLVASGRMAFCDLLAFQELCRAAHLCAVSYAAAVAEGPVTLGTEGAAKSGAAWRSYLAAAALYSRLLSRFGLDPRGRSAVPQLPALPGTALHLVGDDDDE
jgi:phage terminase small subunit